MSIRLSNRVAAALAAALVASPCLAADEATDEEQTFIEEIIVTAEKREENILEVPLTMSAFSEQMIEESGMANNNDLEQLVPGLQFGDDHGTAIRGMMSQLNREGHTDLAVAVYVDGVYTVDSYGIAPNLFDMERVEVARGPQGTLNGRNSVAGSISYFSKRPTEEWDAEVLTEFTDQFSQRYNIAFGGPLSELASFRVSGGYFEGDGAQKNAGTGNDHDAPDQYSIAPQLRFKGDRFDVNLRYEYTEDTGIPSIQVSLAEVPRDDPIIFPAFYLYDVEIPSIENCDVEPITGIGNARAAVEGAMLASAVPCDDPKNIILSNLDASRDDNTERITVHADFDITERLTVRYTFGDTKTRTINTRDRDLTSRLPSAADPLLASDAPVPLVNGEFDFVFDNDEHSHELQLISNFDGPFNFVAGLYTYENAAFYRVGVFDYGPFDGGLPRDTDPDQAAQAQGYANCQDMLENFFAPVFGFDIDPAAGVWWYCPTLGVDPFDTYTSDFSQFFTFATAASSDTRAVFANVEYDLNDQWRLAGGLRYTEDEKVQQSNLFDQVSNVIGIPLGITGSGVGARTTELGRAFIWDDLIWHITAEYSPRDNALIYGRLSTGYRAGGFNSLRPEEDSSNVIGEETLMNYEVGVKGLFLDDRLMLMAGAFYNDYDGFQLNSRQEAPADQLGPNDMSPYREYTANIDGTEIWGFEAEAVFHVDERWRLAGFYNYLDSEVGEFATFVAGDPDAPTREWTYIDLATGQQITTNITGPRDVTGSQLPQQPNHKLSFTAAYTTPLQDMGTLQLLSIFSFTGKRWPNIGNVPIQEIPSYERWDLRANWTSVDEQWAVAVYVQNVLNKVGLQEWIPTSTVGQPAMARLTESREFGVQVRWRPQF